MDKNQLPSNFLKHKDKNPIQRFLIKNFYNCLLAFAKHTNPESVLDAGCGEGFTLHKFQTRKIGTSLEGMDNSKEAIQLGHEMFPRLKLSPGNIYDTGYKANSFDLVVCSEVLEHLKFPEKALDELLRISKQYVILSVPNEPFFMLSNLLRGKYVKRLGNHPEHINHWSVTSFKKLLMKKPVKIIKTGLPFPWILVLVEKYNL